MGQVLAMRRWVARARWKKRRWHLGEAVVPSEGGKDQRVHGRWKALRKQSMQSEPCVVAAAVDGGGGGGGGGGGWKEHGADRC